MMNEIKSALFLDADSAAQREIVVRASAFLRSTFILLPFLTG